MDHRGNKSYLPSKPCVACGRSMTWRKAWARNWDQVQYCSEPCRRAGRAARRAGDQASVTSRDIPRDIF
ncbi:MAG: DUF2256 domain-containing protein [Steroidobacteraceae bacterium]